MESSTHTGAMIALMVPNPELYALSVEEDPKATPEAELHLTLAYLGESADISHEERAAIVDAVSMLADTNHEITALFPATQGLFPPDPESISPEALETWEAPHWIAPSNTEFFNSLREDLLVHLSARGVGHLVSTKHPVFHPHVTLTYAPLSASPDLDHLPTPYPTSFGEIVVKFGDEIHSFSLQPTEGRKDAAPLTASALGEIRFLSEKTGHSVEYLTALYLQQSPKGSSTESKQSQALNAVKNLFSVPTQGDQRVNILAQRAEMESNPIKKAFLAARALALVSRASKSGDVSQMRRREALVSSLEALVAAPSWYFTRRGKTYWQPRNAEGNWIDMFGVGRVRVPGADGASWMWQYGALNGGDAKTGKVNFVPSEGPHKGKTFQIDPGQVSQPKAVLNRSQIFKDAGLPEPKTSKNKVAPAAQRRRDESANAISDSQKKAVESMNRLTDENASKAKNDSRGKPPPKSAAVREAVTQGARDAVAQAKAEGKDTVEYTPEKGRFAGENFTGKVEDFENVQNHLDDLRDLNLPENYGSLGEDEKAAANQRATSEALRNLQGEMNEQDDEDRLAMRRTPPTRFDEMEEVDPQTAKNFDGEDAQKAATEMADRLNEAVPDDSPLAPQRDVFTEDLKRDADAFANGELSRDEYMEQLDKASSLASQIEPAQGANDQEKAFGDLSEQAADLRDLVQAGGGSDAAPARTYSDEEMGSARAKAKYAGRDYGHGSPQHMEAQKRYEDMIRANKEAARSAKESESAPEKEEAAPAEEPQAEAPTPEPEAPATPEVAEEPVEEAAPEEAPEAEVEEGDSDELTSARDAVLASRQNLGEESEKALEGVDSNDEIQSALENQSEAFEKFDAADWGDDALAAGDELTSATNTLADSIDAAGGDSANLRAVNEKFSDDNTEAYNLEPNVAEAPSEDIADEEPVEPDYVDPNALSQDEMIQTAEDYERDDFSDLNESQERKYNAALNTIKNAAIALEDGDEPSEVAAKLDGAAESLRALAEEDLGEDAGIVEELADEISSMSARLNQNGYKYRDGEGSKQVEAEVAREEEPEAPEAPEAPVEDPARDKAIRDFYPGNGTEATIEKFGLKDSKEMHEAMTRASLREREEGAKKTQAREEWRASRPAAEQTEVQNIKAGDLVRYADADYRVTVSEATDRGRFWRISGEPENLFPGDKPQPLDVRGIAPTQEWGKVIEQGSTPELDTPEDVTPSSVDDLGRALGLDDPDQRPKPASYDFNNLNEKEQENFRNAMLDFADFADGEVFEDSDFGAALGDFQEGRITSNDLRDRMRADLERFNNDPELKEYYDRFNNLLPAPAPPWAPRRPVLTGPTAERADVFDYDHLKQLLKGRDQLVFDFEATGLDVSSSEPKDGPVQVSVKRVRDGEVIDEMTTFVNPGEGRTMHPDATKKTGITDDMFADAPSMAEAYRQIMDFAGDDSKQVWVAYNANYDEDVLKQMAAAAGEKLPKRNVLDPFVMAQDVLPKKGEEFEGKTVEGFSLENVAKVLGIEHSNAHSADGDTATTAAVVKRLLDLADEKTSTDKLGDLKVLNDEFKQKMREFPAAMDRYKRVQKRFDDDAAFADAASPESNYTAPAEAFSRHPSWFDESKVPNDGLMDMLETLVDGVRTRSGLSPKDIADVLGEKQSLDGKTPAEKAFAFTQAADAIEDFLSDPNYNLIGTEHLQSLMHAMRDRAQKIDGLPNEMGEVPEVPTARDREEIEDDLDGAIEYLRDKLDESFDGELDPATVKEADDLIRELDEPSDDPNDTRTVASEEERIAGEKPKSEPSAEAKEAAQDEIAAAKERNEKRQGEQEPTPQETQKVAEELAAIIKEMESAGIPLQLEDEKFPLNDEQAMIAHWANVLQKSFVVAAKAGTGKTTTLVALAKRFQKLDPNRKGIYVAFNKSVQVEGEARMPKNVGVKTWHKLAYDNTPKWLADKGFGKNAKKQDTTNNNLEIARDILGIRDRDSHKKARSVRDIIQNFTRSADKEIDERHFISADGVNHFENLPDAEQKKYLDWANTLWADINDPNGKYKLSPDDIRKIWALSDPDLGELGFDFLFVDEAQDTPPVLGEIVQAQTIQKIIVGDKDQSINGWAGAVDYLSKAYGQLGESLPLSTSYRYGANIQDLANRILQWAGSDERVIGGGPEDHIVSADDVPDDFFNAILTRTNAGVIAAIADQLALGRTVAVPKGTKKDFVSLINALDSLSKGRKGYHDDISQYSKWEEFLEAAETGDARAAMLKRLWDENGYDGLMELMGNVYDPEIPDGVAIAGKTITTNFGDDQLAIGGDTFPLNKALWDAKVGGFKKFGFEQGKGPDGKFAWVFRGTPDEQRAAFDRFKQAARNGGLPVDESEYGEDFVPDVTISTAHKSKGLEWDNVLIYGDFKIPGENPKTGLFEDVDDEEKRLHYVAVTRAAKNLDPGPLAYAYQYTDENGGGAQRDVEPERASDPNEEDVEAKKAAKEEEDRKEFIENLEDLPDPGIQPSSPELIEALDEAKETGEVPDVHIAPEVDSPEVEGVEQESPGGEEEGDRSEPDAGGSGPDLTELDMAGLAQHIVRELKGLGSAGVSKEDIIPVAKALKKVSSLFAGDSSDEDKKNALFDLSGAVDKLAYDAEWPEGNRIALDIDRRINEEFGGFEDGEDDDPDNRYDVERIQRTGDSLYEALERAVDAEIERKGGTQFTTSREYEKSPEFEIAGELNGWMDRDPHDHRATVDFLYAAEGYLGSDHPAVRDYRDAIEGVDRGDSDEAAMEAPEVPEQAAEEIREAVEDAPEPELIEEFVPEAAEAEGQIKDALDGDGPITQDDATDAQDAIRRAKDEVGAVEADPAASEDEKAFAAGEKDRLEALEGLVGQYTAGKPRRVSEPSNPTVPDFVVQGVIDLLNEDPDNIMARGAARHLEKNLADGKPITKSTMDELSEFFGLLSQANTNSGEERADLTMLSNKMRNVDTSTEDDDDLDLDDFLDGILDDFGVGEEKSEPDAPEVEETPEEIVEEAEVSDPAPAPAAPVPTAPRNRGRGKTSPFEKDSVADDLWAEQERAKTVDELKKTSGRVIEAFKGGTLTEEEGRTLQDRYIERVREIEGQSNERSAPAAPAEPQLDGGDDVDSPSTVRPFGYPQSRQEAENRLREYVNKALDRLTANPESARKVARMKSEWDAAQANGEFPPQVDAFVERVRKALRGELRQNSTGMDQALEDYINYFDDQRNNDNSIDLDAYEREIRKVIDLARFEKKNPDDEFGALISHTPLGENQKEILSRISQNPKLPASVRSNLSEVVNRHNRGDATDDELINAITPALESEALTKNDRELLRTIQRSVQVGYDARTPIFRNRKEYYSEDEDDLTATPPAGLYGVLYGHLEQGREGADLESLLSEDRKVDEDQGRGHSEYQEIAGLIAKAKDHVREAVRAFHRGDPDNMVRSMRGAMEAYDDAIAVKKSIMGTDLNDKIIRRLRSKARSMDEILSAFEGRKPRDEIITKPETNAGMWFYDDLSVGVPDQFGQNVTPGDYVVVTAGANAGKVGVVLSVVNENGVPRARVWYEGDHSVTKKSGVPLEKIQRIAVGKNNSEYGNEGVPTTDDATNFKPFTVDKTETQIIDGKRVIRKVPQPVSYTEDGRFGKPGEEKTIDEWLEYFRAQAEKEKKRRGLPEDYFPRSAPRDNDMGTTNPDDDPEPPSGGGGGTPPSTPPAPSGGGTEADTADFVAPPTAPPEIVLPPDPIDLSAPEPAAPTGLDQALVGEFREFYRKLANPKNGDIIKLVSPGMTMATEYKFFRGKWSGADPLAALFGRGKKKDIKAPGEMREFVATGLKRHPKADSAEDVAVLSESPNAKSYTERRQISELPKGWTQVSPLEAVPNVTLAKAMMSGETPALLFKGPNGSLVHVEDDSSYSDHEIRGLVGNANVALAMAKKASGDKLKNPAKPVIIDVPATWNEPQTSGYVTGWLNRQGIQFTGMLHLQPEVAFDRESAIQDVGRSLMGNHLMPASGDVPPSVYTMVHEMGHLVDHHSGSPSHGGAQASALFRKLQRSPFISAYSKENEYEGYAESFAQWAILGGRPPEDRDHMFYDLAVYPNAMGAAQQISSEYADFFGWETPLDWTINKSSAVESTNTGDVATAPAEAPSTSVESGGSAGSAPAAAGAGAGGVGA